MSEETRANTFDLVQLTRLTAFRITLGKWLALVAQTALLVAALLPYAVLRHYFGGVDVITDLVIIAHLMMASFVLTAGAVALSAAALGLRLEAVAILQVREVGALEVVDDALEHHGSRRERERPALDLVPRAEGGPDEAEHRHHEDREDRGRGHQLDQREA